MALDQEALPENSGRITAASNDYPFGSSKDETALGAGDGTPYVLERANDLYGMQQALLQEKGITPSEVPDTAPNSQYLEALRWMSVNSAQSGLRVTNAADSEHDITISPGSIPDRDTDLLHNVAIQLFANITKRIDANWSLGNNLGGFPSGLTLAADTWYRVFLVLAINPVTGQRFVDAGFDTAADASNLLADTSGSGFVIFRRVGRVRTNASLNIINWELGGENVYMYSTPIQEFIGAPSVAGDSLVVTVPPDSEGIFGIGINTAGEFTKNVYLSSLDQVNVTPSGAQDMTVAGTAAGDDIYNSMSKNIKTNSSSAIRQRGSSGMQLIVVTKGWKDDLETL